MAGMETMYVGKSLSTRLILLEADPSAELQTSLTLQGDLQPLRGMSVSQSAVLS